MIATPNGWADDDEATCEMLHMLEHRCGMLLVRCAQRIHQSHVRIERTSDKWKALVG